MRPGMAPIDAAEALKTYQRYYETMDRKWKTFSQGEEMFALQVTEYPELEQTAKELTLLDKLYSLYTEAVTTIDNFADILWTDVVANIEQMNEDVGKLQTRCKTMPKALRDWDAYVSLSPPSCSLLSFGVKTAVSLTLPLPSLTGPTNIPTNHHSTTRLSRLSQKIFA